MGSILPLALFINAEIEAQRSEVTCPRTHSSAVVEPCRKWEGEAKKRVGALVVLEKDRDTKRILVTWNDGSFGTEERTPLKVTHSVHTQ